MDPTGPPRPSLRVCSCRSTRKTQVISMLVASIHLDPSFPACARPFPWTNPNTSPHPIGVEPHPTRRGVGSGPRFLREGAKVDRRATSNRVAKRRNDGRWVQGSGHGLGATGCISSRSARWTRRTWWSLLHGRPGLGHSRQNIRTVGGHRQHRHLCILQVVQTLWWNQEDGSSGK